MVGQSLKFEPVAEMAAVPDDRVALDRAIAVR